MNVYDINCFPLLLNSIPHFFQRDTKKYTCAMLEFEANEYMHKTVTDYHRCLLTFTER